MYLTDGVLLAHCPVTVIPDVEPCTWTRSYEIYENVCEVVVPPNFILQHCSKSEWSL